MTWEQFDEQKKVTRLLQNAIQTDRVSHAYLFIGVRGTGKSAVARHMAKALFCERQDGDSCGACRSCRRIENGNHSDVQFLVPQGASIKIHQVRDLQKTLAYRAKEVNQKVYIIDHVDTMTTEAANSLLKYLEEPASRTMAVLTTEKPHAVLPTLLSRCQQIQFAQPSTERIVERLRSEGMDETRARLASQMTAGLDEAREWGQSALFAEFQNLVIQCSRDLYRSPNQVWLEIQTIFRDEDKKANVSVFLDLLLLWYRDLLNVQLNREDRVHFANQSDDLQQQALQWSRNALARGMEEILATQDRLRRNVNPQLSLERLMYHLQEG